ncbi:MAG: hypothetical protein ACPG8X_05035, partial [Candidatus Poseidoniaceae archaeon]
MSSRITILPIFLSLLFILCSLNPFMQVEPFQDPDTITSTDARSSVHEGDWASYKQTPLESYCYGGFAYD